MLTKKEIKEVNISLLESMTTYQRQLDLKFIAEKSKDGIFDPNAVELVKVSVRPDGSLKVGDGQHTIAICRNRGYKKVKCELRYGLTIEEENDWFALENTKSRPQSSKRIWTSKIRGSYEKNINEQNFNNTINAIGYRLGLCDEKSGDGCINCIDTLFSIFKNKTNDDFINIMSIHKSCFKGNTTSLQANFFSGMFKFFDTYKSLFDEKRFIKVFSKMKPDALKSESEDDKYTTDIGVKYARVFVKYYNLKLSKEKQLKMSKLED